MQNVVAVFCRSCQVDACSLCRGFVFCNGGLKCPPIEMDIHLLISGCPPNGGQFVGRYF